MIAVLGLVVGCRPPPLAPLPAMGTCSAPLKAPALGAWTAGPSAPTRRTGGLMMTLTGGRVLFAGGRAGGADARCVTDVELFEPATMAWRRLAPLPNAMCGGAGVELDDGSIFVGVQLPGPPSNWRRGEATFVLYEPTPNQWTEVARAAAPFTLKHCCNSAEGPPCASRLERVDRLREHGSNEHAPAVMRITLGG
ncbi:MAG: hypothetical protein IT354_17125 [Gemmatimonadaceae bacterium]|nr:hypothetical protein [Gemmatimonadaceae bacterium]